MALLWSETSGLFKPKRVIPGLGELSTCLEEMSMEISVLRDTASGMRALVNSMRPMPDFGELWLEEESEACLEVDSELSDLMSWKRLLVEEVAERRGLVVLRDRGDGFVDVSSSTSNDLLSAEPVPVGLVASPLSGLLSLPLVDLAMPEYDFFMFVCSFLSVEIRL